MYHAPSQAVVEHYARLVATRVAGGLDAVLRASCERVAAVRSPAWPCSSSIYRQQDIIVPI